MVQNGIVEEEAANTRVQGPVSHTLIASWLLGT